MYVSNVAAFFKHCLWLLHILSAYYSSWTLKHRNKKIIIHTNSFYNSVTFWVYSAVFYKTVSWSCYCKRGNDKQHSFHDCEHYPEQPNRTQWNPIEPNEIQQNLMKFNEIFQKPMNSKIQLNPTKFNEIYWNPMKSRPKSLQYYLRPLDITRLHTIPKKDQRSEKITIMLKKTISELWPKHSRWRNRLDRLIKPAILQGKILIQSDFCLSKGNRSGKM